MTSYQDIFTNIADLKGFLVFRQRVPRRKQKGETPHGGPGQPLPMERQGAEIHEKRIQGQCQWTIELNIC